ncbi:MAG: nucleoside hydrolase [Lachnospiraceae bacterium]|nr:nucleoside hydrolase [Lachnospiraceae bacterium]
MKREELLKKLGFAVPENKKMRVILHTDAKNEADDQYAILHYLMTPYFDLRGIVAAHFEAKYPEGHVLSGTSMQQSYDEVRKLYDLAEIKDVPLYCGAPGPMRRLSEETWEGVEFIIEEAMREEERDLFVVMLGGVTDVALALKRRPEIAKRMTLVWIGGGAYPNGDWEFNLLQDVEAANILFASEAELWQIPRNAYSQMVVSLTELATQVQPCGEIGAYLFRQLDEYNEYMGGGKRTDWPHGETWCLGDSATLSVLLQGDNKAYYHYEEAPVIAPDMSYGERRKGRMIRVYDLIDTRLVWGDFTAKLRCLYGK